MLSCDKIQLFLFFLLFSLSPILAQLPVYASTAWLDANAFCPGKNFSECTGAPACAWCADTSVCLNSTFITTCGQTICAKLFNGTSCPSRDSIYQCTFRDAECSVPPVGPMCINSNATDMSLICNNSACRFFDHDQTFCGSANAAKYSCQFCAVDGSCRHSSIPCPTLPPPPTTTTAPPLTTTTTPTTASPTTSLALTSTPPPTTASPVVTTSSIPPTSTPPVSFTSSPPVSFTCVAQATPLENSSCINGSWVVAGSISTSANSPVLVLDSTTVILGNLSLALNTTLIVNRTAGAIPEIQGCLYAGGANLSTTLSQNETQSNNSIDILKVNCVGSQFDHVQVESNDGCTRYEATQVLEGGKFSLLLSPQNACKSTHLKLAVLLVVIVCVIVVALVIVVITVLLSKKKIRLSQNRRKRFYGVSYSERNAVE